MKVGVPKEIKTLEFRVGMTPAGVHELVHDGHEVIVETNAGIGIGMTDADYEAAGATVVGTAEEVFAAADMIVKVKEPQLHECAMLRQGQVLFTYLHLAADPAQTEALVKSGTTAIAYETVTAKDGSLPLLTPMSEVAGRLSIQAGAYRTAESQRRPRRAARRRAGRCSRARSSSSAAACRGRMRRTWRSAWAPTSRFSIVRCRACASLTTSGAAAFTRSTRQSSRSTNWCRRRTSSSARC